MSNYKIDPTHSSASFNVKHMMISKVHGAFEKLSGDLSFDPSNPKAFNINVQIETASINTHEEKRDAHLRSADFFDAEKFPKITFHSQSLEKSKDGYIVTGDLNIHGMTQKVSLEMETPSDEVKDPWGNLRIAVSGKTKIKRKDFGLTWNAALETGGVLVGDDVNIILDVQFIKQT